MRRLFLYLLILISAIFQANVFAMDFGLRFNSHAYPLEQRTSLLLGDKPYKFKSEFKVGFYSNFYTSPLFGTICAIITDDGHRVAIVASHRGNDTYSLGLVVDDNLTLLKEALTLDPDREDHMDLTINRQNGEAALVFNNSKIKIPFDFSKSKSAYVVFGIDRDSERHDVAPFELRNARIFIDGRNSHHWDFRTHDKADGTFDELENVFAQAYNPHWLIDDHTDWTPIKSFTRKDRIQTAFDPRNETFYIVDDKHVNVWNALTQDSIEIAIKGGVRPMAYSNHLLYDTISNNLINYNLSKLSSSRFNESTGIWQSTAVKDSTEEASYSNHAFVINDSVAYAFGGYGFYKYKNDFFEINLSNGKIEKRFLSPEMPPLTSSALAIVDGKIYIFGGKGNTSGQQELPTNYYYGLYEFDPKTWSGSKLWEMDSVSTDFLPTQTMYYDSNEDCFYVGATRRGGTMLQISKSRPEYKVVSVPIISKMEFYDCVFDLFKSQDGKHFYLLVDKRLDPNTHQYTIYRITHPFITDPKILNKNIESANDTSTDFGSSWWFIFVGILVTVIAIIILIINKKKTHLANDGKDVHVTLSAESHEDDNQKKIIQKIGIESPESENEMNDKPIFDFETKQIQIPRFDRTKSAISLLGAFNVRSKTGEDITAKFTTRLKNLLILLILACQKNTNGVKYQIIDEEIWSDKDEKSAQNNRNVYMRKLRILLEEVGDVSITFDKGFFSIDTSNIMVDYTESMSRIQMIQGNCEVSPELLEEVLELLLLGPLLPMTHYEWLDKYKGEYSNIALNLLNNLLNFELDKDDKLAYRIADTIACHDVLSEEAMKARCYLLSRNKKIGLAQNVYNKYCKEYKLSFGENYGIPFINVCRSVDKQ